MFGEFGSRLAFLLMGGMTGIFTATNAIDDQMAEILEPTRITASGSCVGGCTGTGLQ
jgi:hypothetical protein